MFESVIETPEELWEGSFAYEIQKVFSKEEKPLFEALNAVEQTQQYNEDFNRIKIIKHVETAAFTQITSMTIREISKNWKPTSGYSLNAYVLGHNGRLMGLTSDASNNRGECVHQYFNFYDCLCEFPFPPGFEEKMLEAARQITRREVQRALKDLLPVCA